MGLGIYCPVNGLLLFLVALPKNKDDDGDGGSDDDNGGNREHIMFQGMLTFISILTLIV